MIKLSVTGHEMRTFARTLFLSSSLAFFSVASLAADEVAVPDMETRIKNSGNSISPRALPDLANPAPVALPEGDKKPSPVTPPVPAPVESPVNPSKSGDSVAPPVNGGVHGNASLGAGSPGHLRGAIAVICDRPNDPDFALGFSHDSADGYGNEDPGDGFFDRETSADARVSGRILSGEGNLALAVTDRTDGFQGKNSGYYSMTHRSLSWDWSVDRVRLLRGDSVFTFGAGSTGWIRDSFAEKPSGAASPVIEIADWSGFGFEPRASVALSRGAFDVRVDAAFCYDTVADQEPAEMKSADAALSAGYASGPFTARARVGVLAESEFDILVPFDVSAAYESTEGIIRSFGLSGGLAADRQDPWNLASAEPFVLLSGVPYHSADWNVAGFSSVAISDPLSLALSATWRSTAYDRGILVLSSDADSSTALIPIELALRDSLSTSASLKWQVPGLLASAGVTDEWLDRLNRKTLHTLDGSLTVCDKSGSFEAAKANGATKAKGSSVTDARWEATARASLPLDSGEYPFLGVSGTVRPARQFAVTLSFDDILPLATGNLRERNGMYAERSGVVALSGSINF